MYAHLAPPSVLPDISPTRGEIDSRVESAQTIDAGTSGSAELISPLVGEMSGRTEGGNARDAGDLCL
ncbi:hypothetical protein AMK01_PC00085 (plasmid) [Rhizobium sp. N6212]|nr:hypothetical protein AMK01_PC00085 [Rhizobium sp. N6212]ANL00551.1 hypothetical protein AMK00_PC00085 [Rhizobium sp. N621]ANL06672.1 hypothetical protein AMJ99_PC00085 [Rhizobium esperanzae]ANL12843.1 hypothetical protein AMJ98_PD00085 [Rhizobium sp. N1341]ANL24829.1 hypothetical protein AMJ96_PC00085 [Rhizobium sp. N113]ANM37516.1 hypothetical protein AMK04_PC00085 [Rhizobium sp. N871]ANM43666.1 hypothetical protein AMK03_PD00085 [Rhizobium sp. N741]